MIERIKSKNFDYLVNRLVHKEHWSLEDAQEGVRQYRNFLILIYKYPQRRLAPTRLIDEVWHAHILYTREYTQDCEEIFGSYRHHTPVDDSKCSEEERQQVLIETAILYTEEFQESYSPLFDLDPLAVHFR